MTRYALQATRHSATRRSPDERSEIGEGSSVSFHSILATAQMHNKTEALAH